MNTALRLALATLSTAICPLALANASLVDEPGPDRAMAPASRAVRRRSIAIVGASLAGLSAARALRAAGFAGRLIVIGLGSTLCPYTMAGILPWARSFRATREPVPLFFAGSRGSTAMVRASAMTDANLSPVRYR